MAEKPAKKEEKKEEHHSKGEISFGIEVLLFMVAIFIIWILAGGTKKPVEQKPLLKPASEIPVPTREYNPNYPN